jgi:hypothetical protein
MDASQHILVVDDDPGLQGNWRHRPGLSIARDIAQAHGGRLEAIVSIPRRA